MKRRRFIVLGSRTVGVVMASNGLLSLPACNGLDNDYNEIFTRKDVKTLDELAETILPATDTPGGGAAGVGEFLALVLKDCYPEEDQRRFMEALSQVDAKCRERYETDFLTCSPDQRTQVVGELDKSDDEYFPFLKELIVSAVTTSEVWLKASGTYNPVPGRYEGCMVMEPVKAPVAGD